MGESTNVTEEIEFFSDSDSEDLGKLVGYSKLSVE